MKEKKDILFLCQFFYPEYISSAQLPYDTARALAADGFSVGALCGYPREYLEGQDIPIQERSEGVEIHRIRYLQPSRSGFLGRLVNYFSFTLRVLLHLREAAGYRCVVVYSNPPILPWIASWAKALFGTRLVFVAYDLYPEVATVTGTLGEGNPICRLMRHINRVVFRRADAVVALSGEMRDYILAHRDIPAEKVRIIPNWHNQEPAPKSAENPLREDRFTVSYFGNMGTMQDMDTILGAVRLLREEDDIGFLFAGHGNKMEALKSAVAEEGLRRVRVYGFLHGETFAQALAASDCALVSLEKGAVGLCVPSKTYCYMMQGLPLAAVMDECDIVRDAEAGAGIWVRCGEAEALAEKLRYLRDHPEEAARMGRKSRALYEEKYTAGICTGQYKGLFRDLLGQPGGEAT